MTLEIFTKNDMNIVISVTVLYRDVCFHYYRNVRTLYHCEAENSSELSFEPNEIIKNGKFKYLNVRGRLVKVVDYKSLAPEPLCVRIPSGTLDSFM